MAVDILTKDDLNSFKNELFEELKTLIRAKPNLQQKEWLKSYEVRKMLGISPGTLQQMRINGTIAFSQVGGLMFYKYDDIVKLMEKNRYKNPLTARNSK
ncbi:MAG: helix-turn-helix domain-containing protein [Bacteroidota bacterium]|nr:helix-turn-helix domain-containing protein [Bacteroidota bacterium]MDP3144228.1 helix-turn-helix domain-containing protein [Bacteroidota bacterium]